MKSYIVVIGLIVLFVVISLCGCNEPTEPNGSDEPIVNGNVTGRTDLFRLIEFSIESFTIDNNGNYIKVGDGFVHQPSTIKYDIKGTFETLEGSEIDLDLIVHYYDENDNEFDTYKMDINNLNKGDVKGFYNTLHRDNVVFFDELEKVTFEFVED